MNRLRIAALGLMLYGAFLLVGVPAAVMAWALQRYTHGGLVLEEVTGTLWKGRAASFVLRPAGTAPQRFADLRWTVLESRLLRGELAVALRVADPLANGGATLALQPQSIRFRDFAFTLSAPALAAFFPGLLLARPGGELSVRTQDFWLGEQHARGEALIEWKDASTAFSDVKPLGSYRARIQGSDSGARYELTTVAGPLQLEGRGAWSRKTGPTFSGMLRSQSPELQGLMRLLGREDGIGGYRLQHGPPAPPG